MQFRFREYNENDKSYNLITYIDVQDYDILFKTLTFMAEHECPYSVEVNTDGMVDTMGNSYCVNNVSLCVSKDTTGEDALMPHFVVDVEEAF